MAEPANAKLERITAKVHRQHASEITSLRKEYAAWAKRAKTVWHAITESLNAEATPIVDEIGWLEPEEADEDDNPLFDSMRSYVEQIDVYKEHQGKSTGRGEYGTGPRSRKAKKGRVTMTALLDLATKRASLSGEAVLL